MTASTTNAFTDPHLFLNMMIQTARCKLNALRADDIDQIAELLTDIDVRCFLGERGEGTPK